MISPFQKLLYCDRGPGIILATSGHQLLGFNATNGELISQWSTNQESAAAQDTSNDVDIAYNPETDQEPPEKKRRIEEIASGTPPDGTITENGIRHQPNKEQKIAGTPAITGLCATKRSEHIVVVTGEDKCIHVFQLEDNGRIEPQSQRYSDGRFTI
jgi:tRNA (guanine-N(7)-)-methyltransferase subunit TRM82